jgi:dihydroneopterin aldolase
MEQPDEAGDDRDEQKPADDGVEPEDVDLDAQDAGGDEHDDAGHDDAGHDDAGHDDAGDDVAGDDVAGDDDPDDDDPDDDDDEQDDDDDDDDDYDEEEGHPEPEVTVEVSGLSLYTHFGVTAAEREIGQRLIVDLRLDVGECDATVTDRVQDTVDYGEVCQLVYLISQQREYRTLERFCAAVADRMIERYELHSVWVKAAKPEPPIPLPLAEVSVEVWREA